MPAFQRTCIVCGGPIESRWLCLKCEAAYGLSVPFRCWPEWAKMLVRLCWRERRVQLMQIRYETEIYETIVVCAGIDGTRGDGIESR
jgi:hypothetical protein